MGDKTTLHKLLIYGTTTTRLILNRAKNITKITKKD